MSAPGLSHAYFFQYDVLPFSGLGELPNREFGSHDVMLVSLTDERPGPVPCLFLSIRSWLKLVYRRETSVFCVIKTLKREGLYAIPTVARSVGVVRGPAESSEFRPLPIDSEDKTKLCLWACMGLSIAGL